MSCEHERAATENVDAWINPPSPDAVPEPGYDEGLAGEIAIQELKEGMGIPIGEIRKEFGLE